MAYTTQQDLEHAAGGAAKLNELADPNNDGSIDLDYLERAQKAADGWIDSHLRKFSPADLAALRAAPTDTIKRLAAEETIYVLRDWGPLGTTDQELKKREMRADELKMIRADDMRAADTKTARASFIDNDGDVSRDGTKGMW
jgi:hypothetical protein